MRKFHAYLMYGALTVATNLNANRAVVKRLHKSTQKLIPMSKNWMLSHKQMLDMVHQWRLKQSVKVKIWLYCSQVDAYDCNVNLQFYMLEHIYYIIYISYNVIS